MNRGLQGPLDSAICVRVVCDPRLSGQDPVVPELGRDASGTHPPEDARFEPGAGVATSVVRAPFHGRNAGDGDAASKEHWVPGGKLADPLASPDTRIRALLIKATLERAQHEASQRDEALVSCHGRIADLEAVNANLFRSLQQTTERAKALAHERELHIRRLNELQAELLQAKICRAEAETKTIHLLKQARERSLEGEAKVHQVLALRSQLAASEAVTRQQRQDLAQACSIIQELHQEREGLRSHLIACFADLSARQAALQQLEARGGEAPEPSSGLDPAPRTLAEEVAAPGKLLTVKEMLSASKQASQRAAWPATMLSGAWDGAKEGVTQQTWSSAAACNPSEQPVSAGLAAEQFDQLTREAGQAGQVGVGPNPKP